MNKKIIFIGIVIICVIVIGGIIFLINKPFPINQPQQILSTGEKLEGQDCRSDSECKSGVCNFIKQDWGTCAAVNCVAGSQAQGLSNISFFCNQNGNWQKIRNLEIGRASCRERV